MAVSESFALPAQPAAGVGALYEPLGGDGRVAPMGVYSVEAQIVGDASAGNANITMDFDPRYTSVLGWVSPWIVADTAAGDFSIELLNTVTTLPRVRVVGTLPGVAEAFTSRNSAYLWYPPPIWYTANGRLNVTFVNVDATETYGMACCVYIFDRNVKQYAPLQWLNQMRIGVNSPVAS